MLGFGYAQLRNAAGTYEGTDELLMRIKTLEAVRGGMSGSPVLTWDGKIAGILVATRCKGPSVAEVGCDDAVYDAVATPVLHVLEALEVLEPRFFAPPVVVWPRGTELRGKSTPSYHFRGSRLYPSPCYK